MAQKIFNLGPISARSCIDNSVNQLYTLQFYFCNACSIMRQQHAQIAVILITNTESSNMEQAKESAV